MALWVTVGRWGYMRELEALQLSMGPLQGAVGHCGKLGCPIQVESSQGSRGHSRRLRCNEAHYGRLEGTTGAGRYCGRLWDLWLA